MRRTNFFTAAIVALITYVALSAFVKRPWASHRGWGHHHWRYDNDDRQPGDQNRNKPDTTTNY